MLHDWASHSWCLKESHSLHLKSQADPSDDGTNIFWDIRTLHPEISITSLETWFLRSLVIYPVDKIRNSFVLWKLKILCTHYGSHKLLALLYAILEWNGFLRPLVIWQVILTKCVCGKKHRFLPCVHCPILRLLCAKEISPAQIIRLSKHPNSLKHTTYSRTSVSFHRIHTALINFTIVWPCIVTDSLWIKPTDSPNSKFIGITTLHVSGSLSAHHLQFSAVHRLWYILCRCTAKNSWWWAERLPETCRVVIPVKMEFSTSVGFIHKEFLWDISLVELSVKMSVLSGIFP
jgi:hypothetical protein